MKVIIFKKNKIESRGNQNIENVLVIRTKAKEIGKTFASGLETSHHKAAKKKAIFLSEVKP